MKTNGEADSSQVSGNCRGRKGQFSLLHRTSMAILCTEYVKAHDARYHGYESFNECLRLATPASCKISSMPDVILHI